MAVDFCFKNLHFMRHGRLDSILVASSIPGIDFSAISRPKIPAQWSDVKKGFWVHNPALRECLENPVEDMYVQLDFNLLLKWTERVRERWAVLIGDHFGCISWWGGLILKHWVLFNVGGNEKQWGSGRSQMLGNGLGPWRSRFIYNLNTKLLNKNHISFSALSSTMNKRLLWHSGMLCRACMHSFFIDCQSSGELRITSILRDAAI